MARRIGILVVHGIGTQGRFEHLANVARDFVSGARLVYGEDKVSVEQPAAREASFRRVAAKEAEPSETWKEVAERPWLTVLIRAERPGAETTEMPIISSTWPSRNTTDGTLSGTTNDALAEIARNPNLEPDA